MRPDIITLAKGLGGGLPIGACIGIGAAGELFAPGDHGSTFGGNPVSCAAALAVLDTIERDDTARQRQATSASTWPRALDEHRQPAGRSGSAAPACGAHSRSPTTRPPRSKPRPARAACSSTPSVPTSIRLAPPLILTEADVDEALPILAARIGERMIRHFLRDDDLSPDELDAGARPRRRDEGRPAPLPAAARAEDRRADLRQADAAHPAVVRDRRRRTRRPAAHHRHPPGRHRRTRVDRRRHARRHPPGRRDRVAHLRPGPHRRDGRTQHGAGRQRAHRPVPPVPDPGRPAHHPRAQAGSCAG